MKTMKKLLIFFSIFMGVTIHSYCQYVDPELHVYVPDTADLRKHESPEWFNNAKLGIMVSWGLYSVPAYAPAAGSLADVKDWRKWFFSNAYAEWYLNSMRIKGSPTYKYHLEHFGENFNYYSFSRNFNEGAKNWSPDKMAEQLKMAGARYVVLLTKHHDGFTLWPSRVHNNNMPQECEPVVRDIVGELTKAVKDQGMKMGLYYSGGLDWTFTRTPVMNFTYSLGAPQSEEYAAVADAHLRELIEKYKPSILWNDIGYPKKSDLLRIIADYYNLFRDGVINNRWGVRELSDFSTPEYSKLDHISVEKWETCRGMGHSFGYNQYEDNSQTISSTELIRLLVDIVSKNGNLLINVGPKADGTIPDIQLERLRELGAWLQLNGESIYDTNPWKTFEGKTTSGKDIRYTQKKGKLYIHIFGKPDREESITGLIFSKNSEIHNLGGNGVLKWKQEGNNVRISFPSDIMGQHVFVLEASELPALIEAKPPQK
jgi:alpha-L-fucosidase